MGIGQNIFFYQNHPIKWVKLTGVVVAIDQYATRLILILDDSSGINIEAICTAPPNLDAKSLFDLSGVKPNSDLNAKPEPHPEQTYTSPDGPKLNFKDIDVGTVVKIHGGLDMFREQMQIRLKEVRVLGDTNEEIKCWKEASNFKKDVLSQPWEVSKEREERCRRRAERGAIKAEKARSEEKQRRRAEELAGKQEREPRNKIRQEKLANKTAAHTFRPQVLPREQGETARCRVELDQRNRGNLTATVSRKSLSGNYDALGI